MLLCPGYEPLRDSFRMCVCVCVCVRACVCTCVLRTFVCVYMRVNGNPCLQVRLCLDAFRLDEFKKWC